MNRLRPVVLALVIAAACSGNSPNNAANGDAGNAAAVRAAIETANGSFAEAIKRGDARAYGSLVTENFTGMDADGTDIVGREAVVTAFAKGMAARTNDVIESHVITDSVEVHGDFAYEVGHNIRVLRPKGKTKAAVDTARSRYITFWRKGADGTWRVSRDFTVATPKPRKP